MNDSEANLEGLQPLTGRRAALADIAERRRKDPNWDSKTDPTYVGPYPTFVELMSNAEFDRHMAGVVERLHLASNPYARRAVEQTEPQPTPRKLNPRGAPVRPAHPRPATRPGMEPARSCLATRSARKTGFAMCWGDRLCKSLTTLTGKADIASAGEMVSAFAEENNLATIEAVERCTAA
jgi:hypothetical protein